MPEPWIMEHLPFTQAQRDALEALGLLAEANPEARQILSMDAAALASGSAALCSTSQEQRAAFGALWALYPALVLLGGVPRLKQLYEEKRIDPHFMWDVLSDLPLWMRNYERQNGRLGLAEYGWLTHALNFRLFRLGRLEYIYNTSRVPARVYRRVRTGELCVLADGGLRFRRDGQLADAGEEARQTQWEERDGAAYGTALLPTGLPEGKPACLPLGEWQRVLSPGDPILEVHIPEGPPLLPAQTQGSLRDAPAFFRKHLGITDARAFTCCSWLMSPALPLLLPGSGIAAFQQLFRAVPYTADDSQIFERVYGRPLTRWEDMPMETRLQRAVGQWYLQGGNCRQMAGFRLMGAEGAVE
ncbi:hypothetical protein FACS1894196_1660 [Clostridia bacterium]|nr:hypothetical protein FACS1894196_1660 [Clostridia bacterium]